ncbi:hypothetical protein [Spiroplasma melliferum]|uniref:Uncharacterized protein n=2 Tax=Spiroplasma melliferum TaxID=2134 RepID=A0AAI9T3E4_SPIME|nr:hypothetical protein [Spiroplasma melliferum]ELL44841.1 hypothetical protein SMIPMB4A_v3c2120 [Spiroplasma melliferum IPMB4A]KAI92736.1 hypothetical protein SPM_001540 [Spiroplasma melliferum KC3]QCO24353.1 putative membrane protein (PARCEL family) [Spiroplasma melliferum]
MKKKSKKWWILNFNLIFLVILLLSFILYVLYCAYGNSRLVLGQENHPVLLSSMINEDDLGTINTNGFPIPTENHIKDKLKTKYHDLNIDDISVTNITQWNATITARDNSLYMGKLPIKYTCTWCKKIGEFPVKDNRYKTIANNFIYCYWLDNNVDNNS